MGDPTPTDDALAPALRAAMDAAVEFKRIIREYPGLTPKLRLAATYAALKTMECELRALLPEIFVRHGDSLEREVESVTARFACEFGPHVVKRTPPPTGTPDSPARP